MPVLLYGCEAWTLTGDLGRWHNVFGTRSLRRILGYRWSDHVSNGRLLGESRMRPITRMIRERQMQLYSHVARFLVGDPAGWILSSREPAGRTHPVERPYDTWLCQMDRNFCWGWGWAVWRPGGWPSGDRRSIARR